MRQRGAIGAVLLLIVLPAVVAAAGAGAHRLRNRNNGSLVSSGEKREYLLYVPRSYDAARPAPLVISMHGAGGWPVLQRDMSGWNRLADQHGFLVVYPAGWRRIWRAGLRSPVMKDVRFLSDLIDSLRASYNIDTRRIYANGLSNGGGMAFVLSCAMPERIAAVGMVASAQMLPWNWCTDRSAVPMIAFHGTADPVTPYRGGTTWVSRRSFPDIEVWTSKWARRNGCPPAPVLENAGRNVTRTRYASCRDGADVVLYTIEGGGHTWPGGAPLPEWFVGPNSDAIDATAAMWDFFRAHPLR